MDKIIYKNCLLTSFLLFITHFLALSQVKPLVFNNQGYESNAILASLQKLKVCASVMYLAAHPDDENTRMIAWMANERKYNTIYLSLTRGDGGQNLIGKEQGEAIGLIRTQELLQARKIDGGRQWFTRAYDFGYSKSPEESFKIWGKNEVLADVVWAIRFHRPDIIICRFPMDGRGGHGHHTASALLAREAFALSADSTAFPDQLKYCSLWQPKRLYWNAWVPIGQEADTEMQSKMLSVDVGEYNPLLGKSMTELAGASRSMHKSQGFGAAQPVGSRLDFLELVEGSPSQKDFMDGITASWSRVPEGHFVEKAIEKIISQYNPSAPERSISSLASLYQKVVKLPASFYRDLKLEELSTIILRCAGIKTEFLAYENIWIAGEQNDFSIEVTNRSSATVKLLKVSIPSLSVDTIFNTSLKKNILETWTAKKALMKGTSISHPAWLKKSREGNLFWSFGYPELGKPEGSSGIDAQIQLEIEGVPILIQIDAQRKSTDPVKGEIIQKTAVVPNVTLESSRQIILPEKNGSIITKVLLTNRGKDPINGQYFIYNELSNKVPIKATGNISIAPGSAHLQVDTFSIQSDLNLPKVTLSPMLVVSEDTFRHQMQEIDYEHIGKHYLFKPFKLSILTKIPEISISRVGYINGPGDEVAEGLRAMGLQVDEFDPSLKPNIDNLTRYHAIVIGVRAYNTSPQLSDWRDALIKFSENGGTVIVQYQTNRGLLADLPFPYTLKLGRARTTEEDAQITYTGEASMVFQQPNKITDSDWRDWVQERGLYYGLQWDDRFLAPLSMNDSGEKPEKGALLIMPYGRGHMIYTGLSFFRQVPAGVPGSFSLLANLLSVSHIKK